jgi:hypothetical protein
MKNYIKNAIGFAVFIGVIYAMDKLTDYSHTMFLEGFKREKFSGKIVKKYIDKKQHNYHMLVIQKKEGRDSTFYDTDSSGFYEFVEIGDSIIKIENSNEIKIVNKDTSFYIAF